MFIMTGVIEWQPLYFANDSTVIFTLRENTIENDADQGLSLLINSLMSNSLLLFYFDALINST